MIPELILLPDRRAASNPGVDYGPLGQVARGRIDTQEIALHREDMCRVAVSIHTCEVSAHDVTRMISRDGNPTPLGLAIARTMGGSSQPCTSCVWSMTNRIGGKAKSKP
ncbi:Tn3 family transposase [Nocardia sp. X0981]